MNPSDVIQFLQENPDFFDRNSALLTDLTVTHPNNGQAISLTERQLIALRDRIAQLEDKFAELLSFGEENDAISEKVHRLSLSLLEAEDFESIRRGVCAPQGRLRRAPRGLPGVEQRAVAQRPRVPAGGRGGALLHRRSGPALLWRTGHQGDHQLVRAPPAGRSVRWPWCPCAGTSRPSACWPWAAKTRSASIPRWARST
jgi:hypothetical protein